MMVSRAITLLAALLLSACYKMTPQEQAAYEASPTAEWPATFIGRLPPAFVMASFGVAVLYMVYAAIDGPSGSGEEAAFFISLTIIATLLIAALGG